MIHILVYWQYIPIYWDVADLAALGHNFSRFATPSVDIWVTSIAFFSQECQYRHNRHFTSCFEATWQKSSCKNHSTQVRWVELGKKRAEKGAETVPKPILANIDILAIHRRGDIVSYWANLRAVFIANILFHIVYCLYRFQPLTPSRAAAPRVTRDASRSRADA